MSEQVRLVWALWRRGIEDGKVLQPLQAGQAVVQADGAAGAAGVVAVVSVPLLGLRGGSHQLSLQLHRALRPVVGTAQGQHLCLCPL